MAELIKIRGCDRPERRGDVIFVHGLNGNPRAYWFPPNEPEKFWPSWLSDDLPDVGVWSLGYENAALKPRRFSLVSKFLQRGFAMPLEDRADNVLLRLESDHIGEKPLVFITHSMGGLLIKEVLRTANDSTNPRRKAIVEQTRGVCFIATPHIGSDLAKWASYFGTFLGITVATEELRPHEPHLRKLNQWYRDFVAPEHRRIKTLSFYEMKPLGRTGLVVAPGDADPGVPGAGLHPLDEDHNSICKPRSKDDQIHQAVRDFIRRDCLQLDSSSPHPGDSSPTAIPEVPTRQDSSTGSRRPDIEPPPRPTQSVATPAQRPNVTVDVSVTIQLTGPQLKLLRDAIVSGFDMTALKELVRFSMNERLDSIVSDGPLAMVAFELLQWTEQRGRTSELILALREARPDNQVIQTVAESLLAPGSPSKSRRGPLDTSAEAVSTETESPDDGPRAGESDPSDERYTSRWDAYRLSIRDRLEVLLGDLARDEGTNSRILYRIAESIGLEIPPEGETLLSKRIATTLCDSDDEHGIPRLMGLHDELCRRGSDQAADVIWECVGRIFPLYLSPGVLLKAWRQLDSPGFVLIRGTVAKEIGAEVVMAGIDGKGPSLVPHVLGPRGEFLIPFEWPAINSPSLDEEVLAILKQLARQANVPFDEPAPQGESNDIKARLERLSEVLTGWLEWDKPRKGRTPYCALAMLGASSESDRRMRVLSRVRELVKPLMFIELDPDSQTLRRESAFFRTAVDRFEIQKTPKPK
jgi:pimeloyl-ACP methyl ester carboxylesterase